jgi:hypothetical protein
MIAEVSLTKDKKGEIMEQTNISISRKLVVAALLWLVASAGEAATIPVNCDAGGKIQAKLDSAKPGDTLLVTGT